MCELAEALFQNAVRKANHNDLYNHDHNIARHLCQLHKQYCRHHYHHRQHEKHLCHHHHPDLQVKEGNHGITVDDLSEEFKKHPGLLENLTLSIGSVVAEKNHLRWM